MKILLNYKSNFIDDFYKDIKPKIVVEQSKERKIIENDFLCTTKIEAAFLSHQSFIIQTCVTPEDDK